MLSFTHNPRNTDSSRCPWGYSCSRTLFWYSNFCGRIVAATCSPKWFGGKRYNREEGERNRTNLNCGMSPLQSVHELHWPEHCSEPLAEIWVQSADEHPAGKHEQQCLGRSYHQTFKTCRCSAAWCRSIGTLFSPGRNNSHCLMASVFSL